MNIQAEKLELIRLIADVNSETVIKKIKDLLSSSTKDNVPDPLSPAMKKRLHKSRKEIAEGKGVKVNLDDIWK